MVNAEPQKEARCIWRFTWMGQPPSAPCVHFCFFAPFRASSAEAKVGRNGRNRLSKCIFARTNRQKRKILLQKMTDYNKYTNFCERLSPGMVLKRGFPQIHADCFFSPQITRIITLHQIHGSFNMLFFSIRH